MSPKDTNKKPVFIEMSGEAPEIFNPYAKENHEKRNAKAIPFTLKCIIADALIVSEGAPYDVSSDHTSAPGIYVYKVPARAAGFWIENRTKLVFNVAGVNAKRPAFCYFHANIWNHLAPGFVGDGLTVDKEKLDYSKFKYYRYSFGRCTNADAQAAAQWQPVPREIFSGIADHAYLFVCSRGEPIINTYEFPKGIPFFWNLPVATSVYSGQNYRDSAILSGDVRVYIPFGRVPGERFPLRSPNALKSCKGHYVWKIENEPVQVKEGETLTVISTDEYVFRYDGVDYKCPSIELYVYKRPEIYVGNPIDTFVWQSGCEDDRVKYSYLGAGSLKEVRNRYPNLLNSLSLNTVFGSYVSYTHTNAAEAAAYVVRNLAIQPPGFRCISIDSAMQSIMGAALYYIEENLIDEESSITPEKINAFYRCNGSHLFYDTPVLYEWQGSFENDKELSDAVFYLRDVLGIREGSNGFLRTGELLTDLFKEIASSGIAIDYVLSDIELIGNEVHMLRNRRFREDFLKMNGYTNSEYGEFYNQLLLNELVGRPDIWNKLLERGFVPENYLKEVAKARETEGLIEPREDADGKVKISYSMIYYGIANGATPEMRRKINIWNAVMKEYINELFYENVFVPVLKYYPNAKCSEYCRTDAKGYINWAGRFETYLGGSVKLPDKMHSCVSLYGDHYDCGYKKHSMDDWKMYPNMPTPYGAFVGDVNRARSSLMSSGGRFVPYVTSWNIWAYSLNKVTGFIGYEKKDGVATSNLEKLDRDYAEVMKAYYREALYHIFLSCPTGVAAYFNTEPKKKKDSAYIRLSGKYNNYQSIADEKEYYPDSFDILQEIIQEVYEAIGFGSVRLREGIPEDREKTGPQRFPIVKPIMDMPVQKTEPFVITGMSVGNKRVWRITFDNVDNREIKKSEYNGFEKTFSHGGKTVIFKNGIIVGTDNSNFGYWIETPNNVDPEISSDNGYYRKHPAYSDDEADLNGFSREKDGLHYRYFNSHTLFGDVPGSQLISFRFKVTGPLENYARIFWFSGFLEEGSENAKPVQIRLGSDGKYKEDDSSTPVRILNSKLETVQSTRVEFGKPYELQMRVELLNSAYAGEVRKKITFHLPGNDPQDFNIRFSNEGREPHTIKNFHLIYSTDSGVLDKISIEGFNVYFDRHFEQLEVFRERDGVNIGQVNRYERVYSDLPVETSPKDRLIGKVSWLNATDEAVNYRVTFERDGEAISRSKNPFKMISCPKDGRISEYAVFDTTGFFTVEANSEGNLLFELPPIDLNTKRIQLKLETVRPKSGSISPLEIELPEKLKPLRTLIYETVDAVTVPIK